MKYNASEPKAPAKMIASVVTENQIWKGEKKVSTPARAPTALEAEYFKPAR